MSKENPSKDEYKGNHGEAFRESRRLTPMISKGLHRASATAVGGSVALGGASGRPEVIIGGIIAGGALEALNAVQRHNANEEEGSHIEAATKDWDKPD